MFIQGVCMLSESSLNSYLLSTVDLVEGFKCVFLPSVLMTMTLKRPTKPNRLRLTGRLPCSPSHRPLVSLKCRPSRGQHPPPPPLRPPPPPRPHHSCSSSQTRSHTSPSIHHPCPSCKPWLTLRPWGQWCLRISFRAIGWGSSLQLLPWLPVVGSPPSPAWPLVSSRPLVHFHSRAPCLCRWPSLESHATVWVWPTVVAIWGPITHSQPAALTGDARRRRGNAHTRRSALWEFHLRYPLQSILSQTCALSPSVLRLAHLVLLPPPSHRDASNASRDPKARQTH